MALINSKGKYIKVYKNGHYEIYVTEAARKKVKESTPSSVIVQKYCELLDDLNAQEERRYYDPIGFAEERYELETEFARYRYNLNCHIVDQEYPIMANIYPDVANSIPEIIEAGTLKQTEETLEAAYKSFKQLKCWGETIDA